MQIKAQFIGGPLDGQTLHVEDLNSIRGANPDGTELEYHRHRLTEPVGPEQAAFIYAPAGWSTEQVNSALLDKFKSRNRNIQQS